MKRTYLWAPLALTLGALACDRADDRASVTTTTSATMETYSIDRSNVAKPPPFVPRLGPEILDEGRGRVEAAVEGVEEGETEPSTEPGTAPE